MKIWNIVLLLGLSANALAENSKDKDLPKLFELPSFKLDDQDGKAFDKSKLQGQVWAVNFIFTSCGDECPLMTSKMRSAQEHLKDVNGVGFVSVTTDPKTDKPKVLKKYAKLHKIDEKNWRLLTGSKKVIVELANKGFKFPAQESSVSHSEKFAVVDKAGWVRGYYDSSSVEDLKQMETDMRRVAAEK